MAQPTETTKHGVVLRPISSAADEARVVALEGRLGHHLPADYREFLLRHNGGRPDPAVFRFAVRSGRDTDSTVDWFLALYDGEHSNLETVIGWLTDRTPPQLLPIAIDPFGNFVLLGLSGDSRGKVYFWDHEREPDSQPDWSNIARIADSFDDFLRGLKPIPPV
jgi:hypothetical protein